jgi:hypothetical protein
MHEAVLCHFQPVFAYISTEKEGLMISRSDLFSPVVNELFASKIPIQIPKRHGKSSSLSCLTILFLTIIFRNDDEG